MAIPLLLNYTYQQHQLAKLMVNNARSCNSSTGGISQVSTSALDMFCTVSHFPGSPLQMQMQIAEYRHRRYKCVAHAHKQLPIAQICGCPCNRWLCCLFHQLAEYFIHQGWKVMASLQHPLHEKDWISHFFKLL